MDRSEFLPGGGSSLLASWSVFSELRASSVGVGDGDFFDLWPADGELTGWSPLWLFIDGGISASTAPSFCEVRFIVVFFLAAPKFFLFLVGPGFGGEDDPPPPPPPAPDFLLLARNGSVVSFTRISPAPSWLVEKNTTKNATKKRWETRSEGMEDDGSFIRYGNTFTQRCPAERIGAGWRVLASAPHRRRQSRPQEPAKPRPSRILCVFVCVCVCVCVRRCWCRCLGKHSTRCRWCTREPAIEATSRPPPSKRKSGIDEGRRSGWRRARRRRARDVAAGPVKVKRSD